VGGRTAARWRGRRGACLAACALTVACALLTPRGPARSQGGNAPGGAPPDTFRVFEADVGPAWIDVNAYPLEQQQTYALFAQKCSKCHTLARPINSSLRGDEWTAYVGRMSRKQGSGISPKDGEAILRFLVFDAQRRARAAGAVDPELLPFLRVSQELAGVRRFPASKQDIRVENGTLRIAIEADPRLDLSRFLAADEGQKLVRWTARSPNRGELVLREAALSGGAKPGPVKPVADAVVRRAAAEAIGSATDGKERVERILDWLDENVRREYRQGTAEPPAILADRRGDATEFTRLFVAMAHAAGVPARSRVGFVARRTGFFLHVWADVWLDGWVPVDPYLGQLPADLMHIRLAAAGDDAMAVWDARRVPGLDRLQLRVVVAEAKPQKGGG
jgi:mono/diheme cytochrome c family protein